MLPIPKAPGYFETVKGKKIKRSKLSEKTSRNFRNKVSAVLFT